MGPCGNGHPRGCLFGHCSVGSARTKHLERGAGCPRFAAFRIPLNVTTEQPAIRRAHDQADGSPHGVRAIHALVRRVPGDEGVSQQTLLAPSSWTCSAHPASRAPSGGGMLRALSERALWHVRSEKARALCERAPWGELAHELLEFLLGDELLECHDVPLSAIIETFSPVVLSLRCGFPPYNGLCSS